MHKNSLFHVGAPETGLVNFSNMHNTVYSNRLENENIRIPYTWDCDLWCSGASLEILVFPSSHRINYVKSNSNLKKCLPWKKKPCNEPCGGSGSPPGLIRFPDRPVTKHWQPLLAYHRCTMHIDCALFLEPNSVARCILIEITDILGKSIHNVCMHTLYLLLGSYTL